MRVPNRCLALFLAICPLASIAGQELIPLTPDTSWNYEMTQESISNSLDLTEPNKTERFAIMYRIGGTLRTDNNDFIKLELYRGNALASTDLITVDGHGIICSARIDEKGRVSKFDPSQVLVKAPLRAGTSWNFEGKIGETKVTQHYKITGEEDVAVPAGKFHAWQIHCEQTSPTLATIDRWFVPGTGFVKVVTKINAPSGGVLQQTSLELTEAPKISALPPARVNAKAAKLTVGLSTQPVGDFVTTIDASTPAIYARWQGYGLRPQANIRVLWIAENVDGVEANYQIDNAFAVAETPNSHGTFKLAQPDEGWMPGEYRVEFYIDGRLAETAELTITK
jgi:hypothetical protein